MLYRPKPKSALNIELSPLIDVVFLLLIFFMVSTRFKEDHGLDLILPKAESRQESKSEHLTLVIGRDHTVRADGKTLNMDDLEQGIGRLLAAFEKKMIVLKVDQDVNHGLVVAVMDAAKKAGAEGLTFAADAKADPFRPGR